MLVNTVIWGNRAGYRDIATISGQTSYQLILEIDLSNVRNDNPLR